MKRHPDDPVDRPMSEPVQLEGLEKPRAGAVAVLLRWLVRLMLLSAVGYGVWWGGSGLVAKRCFAAGMRALAADPSAATRDFQTAVKLRPREPRYRAALGRALLGQGAYAAAALELSEAARLRPDDFGLLHDLGQACLRTSNPAGARWAFQRALQVRPQSREAAVGLAQAAAQLGDWQTALGPLRQLWQTTPDGAESGGLYARALVGTGQPEAALKVCREAKARIAARPPSPGGSHWQEACPVLVAEGDAYRAQQRWRAAVRAYLTALALRRGDAEAISRLRQLPAGIAHPISEQGKAYGPAFSPDGTQLAFYWSGAGASGVYVVEASGGRPRRVAASRGRAFAEPICWAPDGGWLCYSDERTLRIVRPDGTGDRALVKNRLSFPQLLRIKTPAASFRDLNSTLDAFGTQSSPAWSPDGKRIAYRASDSRLGSVTCVADVATGRARSIHRPSRARVQLEGEYPPAWSPDGRVICGPLSYVQQAPDGLTIWSPTPGVRRQLPVPRLEGATPGRGVAEVVWSPDTARLAVLRHGEGETTSLVLTDLGGHAGGEIARDVLPRSLRWRDAGRLSFLRRAGATPLEARVETFACDLRGKGRPGEALPIVLPGEWDLSAQGIRLALAAPALAPAGSEAALWIFDLSRRP